MEVASQDKLYTDEFMGCSCSMLWKDIVCLVENLVLLSLLKGFSLKSSFFNNYQNPALIDWVRFFNRL